MGLRLPESMEEVVYFTNRVVNKGAIKAWAYRLECPECKKGKMGKPVEKGKVKSRSDYYICPECSYREDKKDHESKLTLSVIYTCPHCDQKGEIETPFIRKTFEGVKAVVFECGSCGKKIGVTKKMKKTKKDN